MSKITYVLALNFILFFSQLASGQTNLGDPNELDIQLLNTFILKEVNKLRKNVDAEPLEVRTELQFAADDHATYMKQKERLSHFQRFNREKKTPKNRVDFYGELFAVVGENVQLNNLNYGASAKDKKYPPITTYEQLAAKLVLAWRNSPGHYANMINPDFKSTFCSVAVTPTGEIYACQLFGGSVYFDKYKELNDSINYKPQKDRVCKTCAKRPPAGWITVTKDRQIHFQYVTPPRFHFKQTRMRFYNLFSDGIAADIVIKSQYPCDSASYFNGKMGVRGIPLEPVYRKNFGFIGLFQTDIYLGQVPDYVQEDFEVNLTVVQRKRTCTNTLYYVIPSEYHVNIPLYFEFDARELKAQKRDTNNFTEKVVFEKGKTTLSDEVLNKLVALMKSDTAKIYRVDITGYASIEGTSTLNLSLFQARTKYISDYLTSKGIDSSLIFKKSAENFVDFRSDIAGTRLHKWLKLSDEELKNEVNKNGMSDSLEYLLKNHRYVLVDIQTIRKSEYKLGKDTIRELLEKSISKNKQKEASMYLNALYNFVQKGKMSLEELNAISIPEDKRFIDLLHDRAAMNYYIDSTNSNRNLILQERFDSLLFFDKSNKKINTSLAILDYYLFEPTILYREQNKFFKNIEKRKFVDPEVKARILLNFASSYDWMKLSRKSKKLFFKRVKKYVQAAKLDVDKTFEVASYFSYFYDFNFAYQLTRSKIDETKNPDDLIYFLKLIHLTGLKLSRSTYLQYFRRIQRYSGDQFCTYFNNPALNFQILDDLEIKEIYCEQCAGYDQPKK